MRLIDADAFKEQNARVLHCDFPYISEATIEELIDDAPTVDPVKHGHWTKENGRPSSWVWLCSECGEVAYFCNHKKACGYRYCPNCGAKMDNTNETEVVNFSDGRKLVVPNGAFDSLYYSEDE